MRFEIYHQLGFRFQWNIKSHCEDGTSDGLILAPRYMGSDIVQGMPLENKSCSIFDPQFFRPDICKGELHTYDFFPDVVSEGFETEDYSDTHAWVSAEKCVSFQIQNKFKSIVIPTRHFQGTPSNYLDVQQELFVAPFISEIKKQIGSSHEVLLQLILNDAMLKDQEYLSDILNWVTGIDDINGVYLIADINPRPKQIKDTDTLYSLLNVINILNRNELNVVLGYMNTEAVILSLAAPNAITIGAYENMRMFNIKTFADEEKKKIQSPTPRIYIPKLLQLIDHRYIGAIMRAGKADELIPKNKYQAAMFQPTFKWHFSKPELYQHYFLEFSTQLKEIRKVSGKERYIKVKNLLETAISEYDFLMNTRGIAFDNNSDGSHLPLWLTAINEFAGDMHWR